MNAPSCSLSHTETLLLLAMLATENIINLGVGRRNPSDPFFAAGNSACHMIRRLGVYDFDSEELCHKEIKNLSCEIPGCGASLSSVMELELHYNSLHRYVCATCRKAIPSAYLLDLHVEETHDSYFAVLAERKPMYHCLVEECSIRLSSKEERQKHCIETHKFPSDFRWLTSVSAKSKSKPKRGAKKKSNLSSNCEMDTSDASEPSSRTEQCCGTINNESMSCGSPIKGFVFGRGSMKKSFNSKCYKTNDWHRGASKVSPQESVLEDCHLSTDLLNSLPDETVN